MRTLSPAAAFQCLGVRFTMLLDWEKEYEQVLARELYHMCVKHTYLPVQMVPAANLAVSVLSCAGTLAGQRAGSITPNLDQQR